MDPACRPGCISEGANLGLAEAIRRIEAESGVEYGRWAGNNGASEVPAKMADLADAVNHGICTHILQVYLGTLGWTAYNMAGCALNLKSRQPHYTLCSESAHFTSIDFNFMKRHMKKTTVF